MEQQSVGPYTARAAAGQEPPTRSESSRMETLIRVAVPLPIGFSGNVGAVGRLEAALARIPGVIAAQIDSYRMELHVELACDCVTPRQLVEALYAGLGEEC